MTNEELIRRYRAGDRQALNTLAKQNEGLVTMICNKFTHRERYWEESMQECYVAFTQAVNSFQEKTGYRFTTYATIVIENYMKRRITYQKAQRRSGRPKSLELCEKRTHRGMIDPKNYQQEVDARLEAEEYLAMIPNPKTRAIIMLYLKGYTNPEIAKMFNCSHQAVGALRVKAIDKLFDYFQGDCP